MLKQSLKTKLVKLAPSILATDFARLGEQVAEATRCGAERIHVDVMDGHFVPNITLGPVVVASLRKVPRLPLGIHLMISNPDQFIAEFCEAGSDSFLVHWEGESRPASHGTVHQSDGQTRRSSYQILLDVDQILVMTVNTGFGSQHFLHSTLAKIRRSRQMIMQINPACDLEVDGGIDLETAPLAVVAGANVLVAGTSVFGESQGVAAAMKRLQRSANNAVNKAPVWPAERLSGRPSTKQNYEHHHQ